MQSYHQTGSSSSILNSYHENHDQEEANYLQNQPSLASVPSLTSPLPQQQSHSLICSHQCIATLNGYNSYTSCISLAGKFLITGSSNREIQVLIRKDLIPPTQNPANSMVITGEGSVKSLVVLSDKILSAHQDHKIRVWKINNDDKKDDQKFTHLDTLPKITDHFLKFLNPKNHVEIQHADTVSALALSTDESILYSVSWDRTMKIWQISNFKCLESIKDAHDDALNAVIVSNDGYIYTGSADTKIKIWRKLEREKQHSLVATLQKHKSGVNALAISPDGNTLFSGAGERSILVWEKNDGGIMVVKGPLRGHTMCILCLTMVSHLLFSGSADRTVRVWSRIGRNYNCLAVLEGHRGPVKCLAGIKDCKNQSDKRSTTYLLYTGSLDCDMKVWQISACKL